MAQTEPTSAKGDARDGSRPRLAERRSNSNPEGKPPLEQYEKLIAGGMAGSCAKTLTAPLDRVKLLYQVDPTKAFSVKDALRRTGRIARETGVLSLWRGNGLAMIHVIPYGALVYMTFDNYHSFLTDTLEFSPLPARFIAGAGAGASATMVAYPLDLLRARIMAHVGRNDKYEPGVFRALLDISRREGFGRLWRGLNPTLVGIVPYAGISFSIFETSKVMLKEGLGLSTDAEIPTMLRLSTGAMAGMLAQTCTYPLHVVRRRMQVIEEPLALAVAPTSAGAGSLVAAEAPAASGAASTALKSGVRAAAATAAAAAAVATVPSATLASSLTLTLSAAQAAASGAAAAAAVSVPSDAAAVAARNAPKLAARHYTSIARAIVHIARTEGIGNGLFKGLMLTWMKAPLTTALGFTVNDWVKDWLVKRRLSNQPGSAATFASPDIVAQRGGGGGGGGGRGSAVLGEATPSVAAGSSSLPAAVSALAPPFGRAETPQPQTQQQTQPVPVQAQRHLSSIELICAGSIAGACAKTVIAPGDRIKIIFQTDPARPFSFVHALRAGREIVETSGPLALWRGNGATMVRIMPHAGIVYMCFDRYNSGLASLLPEMPATSHRFVAGAAAGATATALTYPLDLMRARMAIDMSRDGKRYSSMLQAGREVTRTEGWRALYSGITPTLLGVMPYAGLSFAVFETLKAQLRTRFNLNSDRDIPTYMRLSAGGVAGLIAQSATYPLDIVRRRMQVSPIDGSPSVGWVTLMRNILVREGLILGLYKGLSMNWIKSPIAIAVSFTVNDALKYQLMGAQWGSMMPFK